MQDQTAERLRNAEKRVLELEGRVKGDRELLAEVEASGRAHLRATAIVMLTASESLLRVAKQDLVAAKAISDGETEK